MIPDLAVSAKRFNITVFSTNGNRVLGFMDCRRPQMLPEINAIMFEDADRRPSTVTAGTGMILVQETQPVEDEMDDSLPPNTILMEAA